jgi:hypothetical protein
MVGRKFKVILFALIAAVAVVVDLVSCVLGLRRIRGNGPSGVPVIGLLLFCGASAVGYLNGTYSSDILITMLKWYAVFHFLANFGLHLIVEVVLRLFGR